MEINVSATYHRVNGMNVSQMTRKREVCLQTQSMRFEVHGMTSTRMTAVHKGSQVHRNLTWCTSGGWASSGCARTRRASLQSW